MKIDFHTHILPGMDDGSSSIQESLAMLEEESRQGAEMVVLTPHFYAQQNDVIAFLHRRTAAWQQLCPHLTPNLPQLRLGAEVQYFEGICSVEEVARLRIQGTRLLLLEMPFSRWSERMLQDVVELNTLPEQQVVLAHVERYLDFQSKGTLDALLEQDILVQCNASFFQNWKTKHKAMTMLRHGKIHLLGSDCHNMHTRVPNLQKTYQIIGSHAELLMGDLQAPYCPYR